MNDVQNKTENSVAVSANNEACCAWTDPVISRIDIKRTMLFSGSIVDGFTGSV